MKPISQLHKDFDKAVKQFENANLARVVGIEAVKDMQKNIKDQSFRQDLKRVKKKLTGQK